MTFQTLSKKNRVRRRKVKQIPVKANIEAQESFKTEVLEPLVEQAQAKKLHLFLVEAAHFVMLPFLGYLYGALYQGCQRKATLQRLGCCERNHQRSCDDY